MLVNVAGAQQTMKQMMTAVIVLRTFISVRDNFAAAAVACC